MYNINAYNKYNSINEPSPRGLSMPALRGMGGWVLLHIAHVTLTLNCQWQWGVGFGWVLLHITQVTSSLNCQGLRVGPPAHCTCHFNSQLQMAKGDRWVPLHIAHVTLTLNSPWRMGMGPPPNCMWHLNSQLPMAHGGGWVVFTIFHIQSKSHHQGVRGVLQISPTKLNVPQQWNQTDFHCCMPAQLRLVSA